MPLPTMPLLSRRKLIGAAAETVPGTGVLSNITTPLANTLCYDARLTPENLLADGKREPIGNYMGNYVAVPGRRVGTLRFRQELRYDDAFGTLLSACGYKATGNIYKPKTSYSDHTALSIKLWEDGRRKALIGAMGTCTIEGTAGSRVFAEWEFTGVWQDVVAEALPSQAPVTSPGAYTGSEAVLTIDSGLVGLVSRFRILLGNTIEMREDITSVSGVKHAVISAREPTIELDPEAHLIADFNLWDKLLAGTPVSILLKVSDGTHYLEFAAPKAQYLTVGDETRGARQVDTLTFQCNANEGDDELSITVPTGA